MNSPTKYSLLGANIPLKNTGYFRHKSMRKKYLFHGLVIAAVTFTATIFLSRIFDSHPNYHQIYKRDNEDVIDEENTSCIPSAVESFPSGCFTKEQRQNGAVTFNILVAFYIFGAIAIICDDYFVPSLEGITEGLNLAPDVAGATFMAAGSSAPELFTSMISVFITKSEIGLGTILGSAVFNLLFIIGMCGLLAGMVIQLVFWPMFRDCSYYVISIIALILAIYDETVHWYETAIFLLLYAGYILIMYFNTNLECFVNRLFNINQPKGISERTLLKEDYENNRITLLKELQINSDVDGSNGIKHSSSNGSHHSNGIVPVTIIEEFVEEPHVLAVPDGCISCCIWVVALPIYLTFYLTVPDCRRKRWKSWYMVTFLMSVLHIAGLTYVLVWMIALIGDTFGIDDSIMGLTLLAAGTSIPDAMASILAARDGFGGMAISNSIGSNIFDILLCLGLPWFIQTLIVDFNGTIDAHSTTLMFTTLMLLATVFLLVLIFFLRRSKLDKCTGFICIISYFVFISVCIINDTVVFESTSCHN